MINTGLCSRAAELYAARRMREELLNKYRTAYGADRGTIRDQLTAVNHWLNRIVVTSTSFPKLKDFSQAELKKLFSERERPTSKLSDVQKALEGLPANVRSMATRMIDEAGAENVKIVNTPEGTIIAVLDKDKS